MMIPLITSGLALWLNAKYGKMGSAWLVEEAVRKAEGYPYGCRPLPDYSQVPPKPVGVAFGLVYIPPFPTKTCEHHYCSLLRAAGHELPLKEITR